MHREWPSWWEWPLDISDQVFDRMKLREFSETDLREILQDATGLERDHEPGRWIVCTRLHGWLWEIIVEPDFELKVLTVITACPLD